jgi:hypothetical protein
MPDSTPRERLLSRVATCLALITVTTVIADTAVVFAGHDSPPGLLAVGGAAVGALASLLAPSVNGRPSAHLDQAPPHR